MTNRAQYIKQWNSDNPDRVKAYRLKHRARRLIATALWKKNNKGRVNAINNNRRAAKLNATPSWSNKEDIKAIYEQCALLSESTGIAHHVDHIIPLQGKNVCGFHSPNNLQILKAKENLIKGNRLYDVSK